MVTEGRVAIHEKRLKVKKMKEIVKAMNAKHISIEELTLFMKECPSVEAERRSKLDEYRKVQSRRQSRLDGLERARQAKKGGNK